MAAPKLKLNAYEILNTIRDNASTYYQERIPEATRNNMNDIGSAILDDDKLCNEMISSLVDQIAKTEIDIRRYHNKLAPLKKGGIPRGKTIQHLMVNPAIQKEFSYTTEDLLKFVKPDVKSCYYYVNRKGLYEYSITDDMIQLAFRSEVEFNRFLSAIVTALYSGDEMDEFTLMKQIYTAAYTKGHLKTVTIETEKELKDMTRAEKRELSYEVVEQLKLFTEYLTYASSEYNAYKEVNPTDSTPAITFTPLENQNIIMTSWLKTMIDINVLADTFNMSVMEMKQKIITVDTFGNTNLQCVLCDDTFTQARDSKNKLLSDFNPQTLTTKLFLHHWQSLGYCIFANAIGFEVNKKDTPEPTTKTLSYSSTGEISEINPSTITYSGGEFTIPSSFTDNFTFKDGGTSKTATYSTETFTWTIA